RAVTALAAVTTDVPDAPESRARRRGLAPRSAPVANAAARRRSCRATLAPARTRPTAMPTNAGMARDEFHTARPLTRPRAPQARGPGPEAPPAASSVARQWTRATARGKPVTRGMRKFGGGPVAVMRPM